MGLCVNFSKVGVKYFTEIQFYRVEVLVTIFVEKLLQLETNLWRNCRQICGETISVEKQ